MRSSVSWLVSSGDMAWTKSCAQLRRAHVTRPSLSARRWLGQPSTRAARGFARLSPPTWLSRNRVAGRGSLTGTMIGRRRRREDHHQCRKVTVPQANPAWLAHREGGRRGAGVPLGCWIRDGRRREVVSALRCRLGEAGSGFEALPFDGAVDSGAPDSEELGDLCGAVLAAVHEGNQVGFLFRLSLGCLPRSRPLAFATFMPSRVRSRIRSDSNSATIASTLNNCRPTASRGS